eukprot:GEMP01014442.1.p1 GENE.GEMP01014442.1~~GEMP01014442.1.p1  ORF type:complete len:310 (+),score=58.31 GEMP01014442.1:45-974(+)
MDSFETYKLVDDLFRVKAKAPAPPDIHGAFLSSSQTLTAFGPTGLWRCIWSEPEPSVQLSDRAISSCAGSESSPAVCFVSEKILYICAGSTQDLCDAEEVLAFDGRRALCAGVESTFTIDISSRAITPMCSTRAERGRFCIESGDVVCVEGRRIWRNGELSELRDDVLVPTRTGFLMRQGRHSVYMDENSEVRGIPALGYLINSRERLRQVAVDGALAVLVDDHVSVFLGVQKGERVGPTQGLNVYANAVVVREDVVWVFTNESIIALEVNPACQCEQPTSLTDINVKAKLPHGLDPEAILRMLDNMDE